MLYEVLRDGHGEGVVDVAGVEYTDEEKSDSAGDGGYELLRESNDEVDIDL